MSNLSIPTTSPDDYYRQRIDMQPAFNSDLFQQLLEPENLHRAWRQVKANKGAAGIDGMTIEAFPLWMQQGGWQRCKSLLERGEYNPSAVRRVEIDKPDGGKRKLGIPNVIDRVIQQAIAQILTPLFDPFFSTNSFGFRAKKDGTDITLLGLTANTEPTEVHLPSELPQGICVRCVSEAWSFSCIHALHDIQASCLSDAEIASVESGTSV